MKKTLNLTCLTTYITLLLAVVSLTACSQDEEEGLDTTRNSSPEQCGNQDEGKQDSRCHSKPDSFGAAFVMKEIEIPSTSPYECPDKVCPEVTDKKGKKSKQTFDNKMGEFLAGIKGLAHGASIPEPATLLAEQIKSGTTKIVFEFDGISPKAKALPIGEPFKIYVWAFKEENKNYTLVPETVDAGYSSKSFFPNATIDADGRLKTGEGQIILPVESKKYNVDSILQVQNAVLQAKVVKKGKGKNASLALEEPIIHGGLLKASMLTITHQVEANSCGNCAVIENGQCTLKNPNACTTSPRTKLCGLMVPLLCGHEESLLKPDIFTQPLAKTPEGKDVPNAAAPAVVEVKEMESFELKAEMFPKK